MPSYQRINLCGHLGKDPDIRYSKSGEPIAKLAVAVSDKYKDVETTEWFNVVCFKSMAAQCTELRKGDLVTVMDGRLKTQKWQDKEGNDRYTTEVVAGIVFGGTWHKGSSPQTQQTSQPASRGGSRPRPEPDFDDQIPF